MVIELHPGDRIITREPSWISRSGIVIRVLVTQWDGYELVDKSYEAIDMAGAVYIVTDKASHLIARKQVRRK